MRTLYIYADFDWLDEPMLVGELGYESLRGSDSYSFKYDNDWLRQYGSLFLSADINNYPGQQYTQPDRDIFGCFSDALPDRWGRLLLNRREQILATEEKRPIRKLSSFDYLMGDRRPRRMVPPPRAPPEGHAHPHRRRRTGRCGDGDSGGTPRPTKHRHIRRRRPTVLYRRGL